MEEGGRLSREGVSTGGITGWPLFLRNQDIVDEGRKDAVWMQKSSLEKYSTAREQPLSDAVTLHK